MAGVNDPELSRQIEAFQRCIEQRDQAAAAVVLDDDYALMLMHPAPAVMPRARWIELLPQYVVHEYVVYEQRVDIDGDCAAVFSRAYQKATVLGEDRSGTFVLTDVWRRRGDRWRVWKRHSTPLSAGPMPGVR
jgi:hypothetical protein